jgi:hypothetical protein
MHACYMPFFDANVSVTLLVISTHESKMMRWSAVSDKTSKYSVFSGSETPP